jgi:hypothetical protein
MGTHRWSWDRISQRRCGANRLHPQSPMTNPCQSQPEFGLMMSRTFTPRVVEASVPLFSTVTAPTKCSRGGAWDLPLRTLGEVTKCRGKNRGQGLCNAWFCSRALGCNTPNWRIQQPRWFLGSVTCGGFTARGWVWAVGSNDQGQRQVLAGAKIELVGPFVGTPGSFGRRRGGWPSGPIGQRLSLRAHGVADGWGPRVGAKCRGLGCALGLFGPILVFLLSFFLWIFLISFSIPFLY